MEVRIDTGVAITMVLVPAGRFLPGKPSQSVVARRNVLVVVSAITMTVAVALVVMAFCRRCRRSMLVSSALLVASLAAGSVVLAVLLRRRPADAGQVVISEPFYMSKYEITERQAACFGIVSFVPQGRDCPVLAVSYLGALRLAASLSEKTGIPGWTLPSEAQWEWACRAGSAAAYGTGNGVPDLEKCGWYRGNSPNTIHPVGEKTSNGWGLHDMHGNAAEWCLGEFSDERCADNADRMSGEEPEGLPEIFRDASTYRVLRGGSFINTGDRCCYWCREEVWAPREAATAGSGVRLVLSLAGAKQFLSVDCGHL